MSVMVARGKYTTPRDTYTDLNQRKKQLHFSAPSKSTKDWSLYELAGEKRRAVSKRQAGGGISNGLSNLDGQNCYDRNYVCPD